MIASSTARVRCDPPGRYARVLAARFAESARSEWDAGARRGQILFAWGQEAEVGMIAGDGVLLLHLECDVADIDHLEELVGQGVVDVARESDEVVEVQWKRAGGADGTRWA